MFAEERHIEILKELNEIGTVKVKMLSKAFGVTEETVRRDLEKLEKDQKLKRIHGGAISNVLVKDDDDIPFNKRKIARAKEKKEIANKAIQLVQENDVIFIDAGSTGLYFAKRLPDSPLKVITNSIQVALELNNKTNIKIILTGGNITRNSLSLVGPATIQSIKNYHIDKAFFSCKGIDMEWGISDSNEQQAAVKRAAIEMSDKTILMVDSSKVNKKSFVFIESINNLNYIITDNSISVEHFKEKIRSEVGVL